MKRALVNGNYRAGSWILIGSNCSSPKYMRYTASYVVHRHFKDLTGSTISTPQDPHINGVQLFLHFGDIADSTNLIKLLYRIQPEEIDASSRAASWSECGFDSILNTRGMSHNSILEAHSRDRSEGKVLSGKQFGDVRQCPGVDRQRETTPFYPRSSLRSSEGIRLLGDNQLPRSYGRLPVTEYFLTTNRPVGERPLSRVKSPEPKLASKPVFRKSRSRKSRSEA